MAEHLLPPRAGFTHATVVAAEGSRVGLVTCTRCGATVLLDPRDDQVDRLEVHTQWHEELAKA